MKKDIGWKVYFQDNRRYADLINGLGCGGKQYVKPEDLHEVDTEAKGLSAGEYLYQFRKDNKLYPVLTFVLYTGERPWDGPTRLSDILDFTDIPSELKSRVADYSINLIDIRRIVDTSVFQTDFKYVVDFIRYAEDKRALIELVENEPYYRNMDEDALEVVSLYAKSKELVEMKKYKNEGGRWDVCKGIRDLMADSKAEGREEGIRALVNTCKSLNVASEFVEEKLQEQFHISKELATEKVKMYW